MNVKTSLELPTNTCVYERYDPQTLEPVNKETCIRLQELGWDAQDFKGRTVLDIGCNSGLLTVHALRLGAARVQACDVQAPLVDFVARVVEARRLPVTVKKIAFDKLEPSKDKADVVLFMEVLHWLVSQGLELRSVIQKLSQLSEHILYLEFPWSVQEPSIQKQTQLTEETYSTDAVLDELTKYFVSVRVVRFMHYFGFHSGSKRILVEARMKRPEASILGQLPETYSLDVPLSRGRNESYLLNSTRGPLVAKLLAPESSLSRLPEALCTRMFDEIVAARPTTVIAPEKHAGKYLLPASAKRYWMIFPFVGRLPSVGKAKPFPTDFSQLIALFIAVRRDFRPLSADLLKNLRDQDLVRDFRAIAAPDATWALEPGELAEIREKLLLILAELRSPSGHNLDALCHGDLQTGNFVFNEKGGACVIDLDTISVGTIYSDGLTGLIWRGADAATLAAFCENLRPEESRPVARGDLSYAVACGISWFCAVRSLNAEAIIPEQIARLRKGLGAAVEFHSEVD